MILAILLVITPFICPVVMSALALLTGIVQAYIFSILATVYIAAATSDDADDADDTGSGVRADH
jgi:F-type H+-transporting ATPase subunit a